MKTLVCKCNQCRLARQRAGLKTTRIQTYRVRAARSKVKQICKTADIEMIEAGLITQVKVDYYG